MAEFVNHKFELQSNNREPDVIGRRAWLKCLGWAAVAAAVPRAAAIAVNPFWRPAGAGPGSGAARNPKWYGFNLLEYFSTDPDWMKYFPYKDDGMFLEDDFRWIRDWGFNWVRLPMDYRFWTDPHDFFKIREEKVVPIDRAIHLGEKYGIHVNVCLHRAPGYCILDGLDEALTGIHITREKTSLFTDDKTREAFAYQWSFFAQRYKGISSQRVSFNLVNEPYDLHTDSQVANQAGKTPQDARREASERFAQQYVEAARAAIEAIRKQDPERLVLTDGLGAGNTTIPSLIDTGILQSCHTYRPVQLTHYQCEWARGMLTGSEPLPTWPLKDISGKVICDRATLSHQFQPWGELAAQGIPIHFGEMGCYKHTPPQVVLAWFTDTLNLLGELHTGWALWNFRGPFGVLDTQRPGTTYEAWHGHQLDRRLLSLLQQQMKS